MQVCLTIDWLDEPALEVDLRRDSINVTAHAGLSRGQVRAACAQLDDHGLDVFRAWQAAVSAG
jgi:hypothetical protein